jgi:hypothetical protein
VARPVETAAGARITGLDIALPCNRVFRVMGHLTAPAGTTGDLSLEAAAGFDALGQNYGRTLKPNGDFEIAGVPPGSYLLTAYATPPRRPLPGLEDVSVVFQSLFHNSRRFRAAMPLDVGNADVADVSIAVAAGPEVEGRIDVEGDDPVKIKYGFIEFEDAAGLSFDTPIVGGQTFGAMLSPGSYSVSAGIGNLKLVIKSIHAGQIDVLRDGLTVSEGGKISLEIVLAPDGGVIEGVALDKDEKPVAGATVLLVPEAPFRGRHERFEDTAADQHGRYKFENVAPGDYKVFVWDDIESGVWFDPDFFRNIESHGEPAKLNAKGHETVKVHILEAK